LAGSSASAESNDVKPAVAPVTVAPLEKSGPRFRVTIGRNTATHAEFANANYSDNGGTNMNGTAAFDLAPANQFGVGVISAPVHSWGYSASFVYEEKRVIESKTIHITNYPVIPELKRTKPSIQFNFVEANAIYRWSNWYLPVGLNFSMPSALKKYEGQLEMSVMGGMGGQAGFGYFFTDSVSAEILYKLTTFEVNEYSSSYNLGYSTGSLDGLVFLLSAMF
jgi:hypothetical protein